MSLLTAIQFSLLYFLDILDLVYIVIRSMNTNMGIVPPNLKYSKCLEYISTRKEKKEIYHMNLITSLPSQMSLEEVTFYIFVLPQHFLIALP